MVWLGNITMNLFIGIVYLIQLTLCISKRIPVWDGIRLRGKDTSGNLEVKVNGRWGLVCDHDWTITDANVACRQLQFDGALVASTFNARGRNRTIITLYQNITCTGKERALEQCNGTFGTRASCWIGDIVQVQCIPPSRSNNTVKCLDSQFLCKVKNMCIPQRWKCDTVSDCGDDTDETNCIPNVNLPLSSQPFRLVDGKGPYEGRLEIQYAGIWGTVCDDGFSKTTADVFCRQLGYIKAVRVKPFRRGKGQIWLDEIRCRGNETTILDCLRKPFGAHDCVHREDVGVVCEFSIDPTTTQITSTLTSSSTVQLKQKVCGTQHFNVRGLRIVGGQIANKGSWPWQATINVIMPFGQSEHICGGTLISEQWVLTSAHCFDKTKDPSKYEVILGENDLNKNEASEQKFVIENISIHDQYASGNHPNDIALIKLSRSANLTSDYTNTACLPTADTVTGSRFCYATGWGDTQETSNRRLLNQVRLPMYPHSLCIQRYGDRVTNDMLCAGYEYGGKDACKGDSGGPLVCKENGRWYVTGIVTWGQGCAEPHHPGVYMNVQHYLYWIKQTMTQGSSHVINNIVG